MRIADRPNIDKLLRHHGIYIGMLAARISDNDCST